MQELKVKLNLDRGSCRITGPLYLGATLSVSYDRDGAWQLLITEPAVELPAEDTKIWAQTNETGNEISFTRQVLLDRFTQERAREPDGIIMAKVFVLDSDGMTVADGETTIEYSPASFTLDPLMYPTARETLEEATRQKDRAREWAEYSMEQANRARLIKDSCLTIEEDCNKIKEACRAIADEAYGYKLDVIDYKAEVEELLYHTAQWAEEAKTYREEAERFAEDAKISEDNADSHRREANVAAEAAKGYAETLEEELKRLADIEKSLSQEILDRRNGDATLAALIADIEKSGVIVRNTYEDLDAIMDKYENVLYVAAYDGIIYRYGTDSDGDNLGLHPLAGGKGGVEVYERYDRLPEVGEEKTIYCVVSESFPDMTRLYVWNSAQNQYTPITNSKAELDGRYIRTVNGNGPDSNGNVEVGSGDAALLAVYYPEGNVTSVGQITTEGLTYELNGDGTATVTGYTGSATDIVIPWKTVIDGVERVVTAVGDNAFYQLSITSVIAPVSVTSIGDSAFENCDALTSISFPSATSIGFLAFGFCDVLKNITFPSAKSIDTRAFGNCPSLKSISLPSATSIGGGAFSYCPELTNISLPSATRIGDSAFGGCSTLTSIDFGSTPRNTVPTLGSDAFVGVPTTCKFIVPLGMYDGWIAANGWKDLYEAGYKFMGYADAGSSRAFGADIEDLPDGATYDELFAHVQKLTKIIKGE